jgi:molybdopterin converting factor small subunit
MVRILYFAVVRERLGRDSEEIAITAGMTAGQLLEELERRHPALGGLRGPSTACSSTATWWR